jgi:peptidoglycan-N-acetylglucosamine deacetylase
VKAALSLDLDNQWAYMKTHGDAGWQSFPSYLDIVVPRALEILEALDLHITFFVVGQDAEIPSNWDALRLISTNGHEIGNHSFHHEPWLHRRSESEIENELERAEWSIESATGHRPRGFRGPGFVHSDALLSVLARREYAYDASMLPTFIGPLARAYYFRTAKLDDAARLERMDLFGSFKDGLKPNWRHLLETTGGTLQEIPVTTMPGLRLPIHISYVLYLATVSTTLAQAYFRFALELCRITRTEPSILLHPLDFIDDRDCPALRFFPAMNVSRTIKRKVVERALRTLASTYEIVPLLDFARAVPRRAPIEV